MGAAGSRTRARWGSITREQVIEAASRLVRQRGADELTIRSLAAELDVAPMSIYRHVRDKDDVLAEVVDRLFARRWRPRRSSSDWKAWVVDAADRLREFLVKEPAALHVYLSHPVVSPSAIVRMDAMLGMLEDAGLDAETARSAYGAIHTYTIGFAALETSRERAGLPGGRTDALTAQLANYTTARQFKIGLGYLLDGVERAHLG